MILLIIDDSKNIRTAIKKSLELTPSIKKVLECEDVDDGIKYIKKYKPDVLILDIMLKTGTGIDLLKAIENFEKRPYTILFSNFLDVEYKKKASKLGVNDFFDKSEDILKLVEKISAYINQAKNL